MKLSRTAALSAAATVVLAGGVTAGFVIGSHSADANEHHPEAGPSAEPSGKPGAEPSTQPSGEPSTKPSAEPTARPTSAVPALAPAQVQYAHRGWGDPATEVGVIILAPKTWSMVKLSTFEVRFSSPNKLWNLRVNANASDLPVKMLTDRKLTLASTASADFRLISRVDGTTKATNPNFTGMVFHHTTFTYTYTDPTRGPRLVVDRLVSVNDAQHTLFEIVAGGRPQDASALAAITATATRDFIRLP
ncbi:PT domain-containing protein [Kribbella qitaiheensis]|uniref:PT domain-containing protein n=1 Tax=Kribbella qitaiheensis TaxID=1544730 RepID=UPI00361C4C95